MRGAAYGLAGMVLLGLATAAAAVPSPAPLPPGVPVVADTWRCERTPADPAVPGSVEVEDCAVQSWATLPSPVVYSDAAPLPVSEVAPPVYTKDAPLPVAEVAPPAPVVYSAASPLPVAEVAPYDLSVAAMPAQTVEDVNRLATYVPGAAAVVVMLLGVAVPLLMRAG